MIELLSQQLSKKGRIVLDIPPLEGNPRNSEGAFITLKDGRLLFVYSRFLGESYMDDARACVAARYSEDSGETWSEDHIWATPEEYNALNVMSVSLLRMINGDLGLFYVIKHGMHDTRLHLRRSANEGETWGEPICCVPGLGYYVTNNDRVVRLTTGRLIVPAAFHKMKGASLDESEFPETGTVYFYLSDDDGATWRESRDFCALPIQRSVSGLQEPGVVELDNGDVWAWARTDMGYQYEMFSSDGGETWGQPTPSIFTSAYSPLSMKRMPDSGNLLAIWNPIPNYLTRQLEKASSVRSPLLAAISRDDGKTWGDYFGVEFEEDRGGYCYTAIYFTEDAVFLSYCAGEPEDGICLARTKIRKIMLSEVNGI